MIYISAKNQDKTKENHNNDVYELKKKKTVKKLLVIKR